MRPTPSQRRDSQSGVTLVEVLLVVALMALMTGFIVTGSGMMGGTRMRSAATLILAGVRLGVTRANSTGLPTRLVFDLDEQRVHLEETQGRMRRSKSEEGENPAAGAEAATEAEKAAEAEAKEIVEGPRAPRALFSPVEEFGFDGEEPGSGRSLGKDITFLQVQTEHDAEPRTEGRAYLYFWPGGWTEKAVIQLTRPGDEEGLSVLVSRLTGRAKIVRGAVQLDERARGADFGEREEEL